MTPAEAGAALSAELFTKTARTELISSLVSASLRLILAVSSRDDKPGSLRRALGRR